MGVYEQEQEAKQNAPRESSGATPDVQGAPPVELNDGASDSVTFHNEPEEKQLAAESDDDGESGSFNFHPLPEPEEKEQDEPAESKQVVFHPDVEPEAEEKAQPPISRLPGAAGFAPGSGASERPQGIGSKDDLLGRTTRAEVMRKLARVSRGVAATDEAASSRLKWKKRTDLLKKAVKLGAGTAASHIPIAGAVAGAAFNLLTGIKAARSTERHRVGLEELKKQMTAGENGVPKANAEDVALVEYAIAQKGKKEERVAGAMVAGTIPYGGAVAGARGPLNNIKKRVEGTYGVERNAKALDLVARAQLPGAAGMWAQAIIFELVDGDGSLYDAIRNAADPLQGAELVAKKLASS